MPEGEDSSQFSRVPTLADQKVGKFMPQNTKTTASGEEWIPGGLPVDTRGD